MMTRLELLAFLLALFIAVVFFLRSKTFDNFIRKLTRGSKSETASELKADIKQTEERKKQIAKDLEQKRKQADAELNVLNKL